MSTVRIAMKAGALVISILCMSNMATAQVGCPCPVIKATMTSTAERINSHTSYEIDALERSVVTAIRGQTKQLSGGQEKMIAALEALNDASSELARRLHNEARAREAVFNRASTHSGCMAATVGSDLKGDSETGEKVSKQVAAAFDKWNNAAGFQARSKGGSAKHLADQLAALKDKSSSFGNLVMDKPTWTQDELNRVIVQSQALTPYIPDADPALIPKDNGDAYIKAERLGRVRDVVQGFWGFEASFRAARYKVPDWYKDATGNDPAGPVSIYDLLLAEGKRRHTSLKWHGEMSQANETILAREQARMMAFSLYLQTIQAQQMEQQNALLATIASKELDR